MSVERFVNALRDLQKETATTEGRVAVLDTITELEKHGRIDALKADSWRGLINWLADIDLEGRDARSVFDELAQEPGIWRAINNLGLT